MRYDKENRKLEKIQSALDESIRLRATAEAERDRLYNILDGIMHETRRLNSEIASSCDDLARNIQKNDLAQISEDAESIFYKSGLISSRLTFADFEINPEAISRQTKLRAGIYKKFDKARRVLSKSARKKHVNVELKGNSYNEIEVIPAFELVPFVLLDNAIKYSPDNQDVNITFEDNPTPNCRTRVVIVSMGPIVKPAELEGLLERGKRGSGAIRSKIPGEGIGLFLARTLMQLANGSLTISSSGHSEYSIHGIDYSQFTVTLEFR